MSGGRPRSVDDDELIELFLEADDPVLTTAEIAEELPIGQRATLKRLSALAERDVLKEKTLGGSGSVWWLQAINWYFPAIDRSSSIVAQLDPNKPHGTRVATNDWTTMDQYLSMQPDERYEPENDRRRRAVRAAYEYLTGKDRPVSKREFVYDVWPEHQAGYETEQTWWQELIRPHFKDVDTVRQTDSREWVARSR